MSLTLYSHPFSSYCQKVLIALWENELAFAYRNLEEPGAALERQALWPLGRFPVLVDDGRVIAESSIIIEHLHLRHAGPIRLLPDDPDAALEGPVPRPLLRQLRHGGDAEAGVRGAAIGWRANGGGHDASAPSARHGVRLA